MFTISVGPTTLERKFDMHVSGACWMGTPTGNAHGIHFRVVQMKYRAFLDTVSLKYRFS